MGFDVSTMIPMWRGLFNLALHTKQEIGIEEFDLKFKRFFEI
jgi:hypothetical protein